MELQRDLAVSYNDLGVACQEQNNFTGAKEFHEKSLAIRERLAEKTDSVEAQRNLAESYGDFGAFFAEFRAIGKV